MTERGAAPSADRATRDEHWRIYVPPVTIDERVHELEHMLMWQVRGDSDFRVEGREVLLHAGGVLWIPAGYRHSVTVRANSVLLPMLFPVSVTATTLRDTATLGVDRELRTLMLAYIQTQNSIIRPPVNLARQILALLEERPERSARLPFPTSRPALGIAETLHFNPGDDRPVEELAASVHTSERTLGRAFVAETGMTVRRWRIRNRMEAARSLLRAGESVGAVARRVGYANVSAFGRAFKAEFEMAPGEYRQAYGAQE